MKTLISSVVIFASLAAPAASFAQQNDAPLSRAQVRAELVQLEKAGYNPNISDPSYPSNIQSAQARVSDETLAQTQVTGNGYGPGATGSTQSGRTGASQPRALNTYFGQ